MCNSYSKTQPCKSCPYRRDAVLRHWSIEEFQDLLDNERDYFGAVYGCHTKDGSVCIGWLMDQDKRRFPSISLRLSLSRNKITREYLDKLGSNVEMYDNVEEMINANYPEIFDND